MGRQFKIKASWRPHFVWEEDTQNLDRVKQTYLKFSDKIKIIRVTTKTSNFYMRIEKNKENLIKRESNEENKSKEKVW